MANLLILQGAGEVCVGLMSLFASVAISTRAKSPDSGRVLFLLVVASGALLVLFGGLKIVAGVRNRQFRSRILGYVALLTAIPAVVGGWCAPTGLAIMIYGLVVYSRKDVAEAFDRSTVRPASESMGLLS